MQKLENLTIWKESMQLVEKVYRLMNKMPQEEKFNLTSQIKRCSVSIPSNIAEGAGRNTAPDFSRFLALANGSSFELKTQLLLAEKMEFLKSEDLKEVFEKIEYIQKMNFNLQKKLETK